MQFDEQILSLTMFAFYFHCCLLANLFFRQFLIKKWLLLLFTLKLSPTKQKRNCRGVRSYFRMQFDEQILSLPMFAFYFHCCLLANLFFRQFLIKKWLLLLFTLK